LEILQGFLVTNLTSKLGKIFFWGYQSNANAYELLSRCFTVPNSTFP
jgi:hypothetical protein